jgi:O-acetyl-ADP-ribose deacetylase (regulator of RNase III)
LEINEFLNSFAYQIVTLGLEHKQSEYKYLHSQRDKLDEIKKSTNILIDTSLIRKHISVSLNSTDIELLEGNLIHISADANVSPANKELNNNGGLAHSIIEKAGKLIQKECDEYVKSKKLNIGDIFVTGSGRLGVKINSIIIHAIAPIWENGSSYESLYLAQIVLNCLLEAEKRGCESIVIPAISTGIFNHPDDKAVELISEKVIGYFSDNPQTRIKRFIFLMTMILLQITGVK